MSTPKYNEYRSRQAQRLPTPSDSSTGGWESSIQVISSIYRAAWPQLRTSPLELSLYEHVPPSIGRCARAIESKAHIIVNKHGLMDEDVTEIKIWMRRRVGMPQTSIPTLVILTPWSFEKQEAWKEAVKEMARYCEDLFQQNGMSDPDFHIEMIAPEMAAPIYYGPVEQISLLEQSWDLVRGNVFQRLEFFESTRGRVTSIGLFRYGLEKYAQNPITIFISVDFASDETQWLRIMTDIKSMIDQHEGWGDVQVHMEHNVGMGYQNSFELVPPQGDPEKIRETWQSNNMRIWGDYQQAVNLGDDFGPARYITLDDGTQRNSGDGTIGCYIELKSVSQPAWTKYALTNYHVVRAAFQGFALRLKGGSSEIAPPEKDSDLLKVDERGYFPEFPASPVRLESPSRLKHNYTLWAIEDEIADTVKSVKDFEKKLEAASNEKERKRLRKLIAPEKMAIGTLQREANAKREFFESGKQAFGNVYAASGFKRRTTDNMRLDWAIIEVDAHRQGSNKLPERDIWEENFSRRKDLPSQAYGKPLQDQTRSIMGHGRPDKPDRIENGFLVYKVGTTTGSTIGKLHSYRHDVVLNDGKHLEPNTLPSHECVIQPLPRNRHGHYKFCARGDSGSAVFDDEGGIVGLFFRGMKLNESYDSGYGYATPIEHVFEDIIKFGEGSITDIRVAQEQE